MNNIFTEKQVTEIKALKHNEFKRLNIYDGSVRSGKTWVSCVIWCLWVATRKGENNFLMCAKNLTALKRNVLEVCIDIFGSENITYSINTKTAVIFGKIVYLEGANDSRAESKIRGLTLSGAYCDELSLFPEDFFKMLLSRLSVKDAKLFATTNPDSPHHWLYTDYLTNKEISLRSIKFLIDDNTTLDPEYLINLKKEYTGVFYDRFIRGLWVIAEGLIYPHYQECIVATEQRQYVEYQVSMDYGIMNPTAMLLWGRVGKTWYGIKEYYHSGRDSNEQKTDDEYYAELVKLTDKLAIRKVIIDPSAASFITLIRRKGKFAVVKADNAVIDGIRNTSTAIQRGVIKVNDCCKETIKEFQVYSWDDGNQEDKPIKEFDHAQDAMRYFVQTNKIVKATTTY